MIQRILDVDDIQGAIIRRLTGGRGPTTRRMYAQAHGEWLRRAPGRPTAHDSALELRMYVNHGRWVGDCPECRAGVATGRGWDEARCFGCGAVFRDVRWPKDLDAVEAVLLKRLPAHRHMAVGETPAELLAENIAHGVVSTTGPGLALLPAVTRRALLGGQ